MKRSATTYSAFIALLALMLVACGGGNDGALQLSGMSSYTMTLTAAPSTLTTATSPVTLTATVRDPAGAPVTGRTVTFSTTAGRLPTDSDITAGGIASVSLLAGSGGAAVGAATATFIDPAGNIATATLPVSTAGNETTAVPGSTEPTIAVAAFDSDGVQSDAANPITSTSPGTLRALVLSATGAPIAGVIVTFNAGSLATVSQASALTDTNGAAQVTITATAAGAGTATASATVGSSSISDTTVFATTTGAGTGTTTGASLTLQVRSSTGALVDSSNPLTNLAPGTLSATLTQNGAAVPNQLVTFSVAGGVASLSQSSALTDSSGRAVVPIVATATGAGSASASASVNGVVARASAVYATSTGGGVSDVPAITLAVLNAAGLPVNTTNQITDSNAGKLRATVTIAGVPQANQVVTFALVSGTGAALSQEVALTSALGVAEVPITAEATGAGTVSASATVNSVPVSTVQTYATQVTAPAPLVLALGNLSGATFTPGVLFSNATAAIAPGTSVIITAFIRNTATNQPYTDSLNVTFNSTCASQGKATLDSPVASSNGQATTIYVPGSCSGTDTITATLQTPSQTLQATAPPVTITAEDIGQIAFISATPTELALKGTGGLGRLESSDVIFQVLGVQGSPLLNKRVCFGLSTTVGGILLSPAAATSDNNGMAKVTVSAGNIPTPVRVNAFVDDNNDCSNKPTALIQTVSDQLTISTGLPDQKSFSVAVENLNPLAFNYDGVEVIVTAFAGDHFNNPVPDGTAVTFWTESGSIQPNCITSGGTCTVIWRSQNPRSSVDVRNRSVTSLPFRDRRGRSTILAYAVGEESFTDGNGNGVWDVGESFRDLNEVIKDSNGDGILDSALLNEEFVDFNESATHNAADGQYDGVLCTLAARSTLLPSGIPACSGNATVHVRSYNEIVMSTNSAKIYPVSPNVNLGSADFDVDGSFTGIVNPANTAYTYSTDGQTITNIFALRNSQFSLLATDSNGNTLAAGTKIAVKIDSTQGSIIGTSSYTVSQASGLADWFFATFAVKAPSTPPTSTGVIEIEVVHPAPASGGDPTTETFYLPIDWITP